MLGRMLRDWPLQAHVRFLSRLGAGHRVANPMRGLQDSRALGVCRDGARWRRAPLPYSPTPDPARVAHASRATRSRRGS